MIGKGFDLDLKSSICQICESLLKAANEDIKPNRLIEKFENCFKLINILIELQKDYSLMNAKKYIDCNNIRLNNFKILQDSFKQSRFVSKVCIMESKSGNGLGVFAEDKINKHEVIMMVPDSEMITEREAYASKFGEFLQSNPMTKKMPNISLALFLLNECYGGKSKHIAYIDSLPVNVNNFLYLQGEDIQFLRHSQYLCEIVQQYSIICSHYCYFLHVFVTSNSLENCNFKDAFCFEDFRWAVAIVMSRNNAIPSIDGQSKMLALIPFWDMMNHKNMEMTTDFSEEKRSLMFYSMDSYETGDEICMDYGNHTNFHYFVFSGFIPDHNPHDKYKLKIGFNKQDSLYNLKQQVLSKLSIDCESATFAIDYGKSNIVTDLLGLYLAVMLTKDQRILQEFLLSSQIEEAIVEHCKSVQNDVKSFMETRIKMHMSCINKSLEQMKTRGSSFVMPASLLNYERRALEKILEKCS